MKIWRRIVSGYRIAIYRRRIRLKHLLLDGSNTHTSGRVTALTPEYYTGEIMRVIRVHSIINILTYLQYVYQERNLGFIGLLGTCRMM